MLKGDFDKLLLEAVDEGLASLGESSQQAIYYHLETRFKIRKQEIPNRIEDFAQAIQKIFGLGANFLEILIMKQLYEKAGAVFEWHDPTDFTFTMYVAVARQNFQKRREASAKEELVGCEEAGIEI